MLKPKEELDETHRHDPQRPQESIEGKFKRVNPAAQGREIAAHLQAKGEAPSMK
jgi:hypothetical protein